MKKVIFPGSFDPPTRGHLNIIERAAKTFDQLVVAVGLNLTKQSTFFSIEERVKLLQTITEHIPNVEITAFNGLLVDHAKTMGVKLILRAIRTGQDLEYENPIAFVNRKLSSLETVYLPCDEQFRSLSSSLIREMAFYGKRLQEFVPEEIEPFVFKRLNGASRF